MNSLGMREALAERDIPIYEHKDLLSPAHPYDPEEPIESIETVLNLCRKTPHILCTTRLQPELTPTDLGFQEIMSSTAASLSPTALQSRAFVVQQMLH